jgi:prephenate dehydrogenase
MEKTQNDKTINETDKKKHLDFEAEQNATGFFNLLLKVAKRNPEIWKQIFNENNENNRDTNNTNKA